MGNSRELLDWYTAEVEVMELRRVEAAWLAARTRRREARHVRREAKLERREARRQRRRQREQDVLAWSALMEPFAG